MVKALNINDVVVVGGPLFQVSAAEVDALQSKLWIKFPSGYREYLERLGDGILGDTVQIYHPSEIERELTEWRRRIKKYWRWDETLDLLPKERAVECVIVGESTNGDELIFHPCRPDRLFILPINFESAYEVGSNLLEAVEWMCSSGQLTEAFPEREFQPYKIGIPRPETKNDQVIDPEGEGLDDIVDLAKRWAVRHSARDYLQAHLYLLEKWVGKDTTTTKLIYEGIDLTSDNVFSDWTDRYVLKYSVMDVQSQSKLGVFHLSHTGDSAGIGFTRE